MWFVGYHLLFGWLCHPFYLAFVAIAHTGAFVVFIPLGAALAAWRLAKEVLVPLCGDDPSAYLARSRPLSSRRALFTFFVGETLYTLASASSKMFLSIYFLVYFAMRDW